MINVFDRLFLGFEGVEVSSEETVRSIMIINVKLEPHLSIVALVWTFLHGSSNFIEMEELVSLLCHPAIVIIQ